MLAQQGDDIGPVGADVGQAAPVDEAVLIEAVFAVVCRDFPAFCPYVVRQEVDSLQACQQGIVAQAYAVHVDVDGALDAPATRLGHAAPVLERIADQRIGGDRGYRHVPVLHLDRGQRDIQNITVGTVFRHFYPVTACHHAVCGELDAGDESEDGILEDQHEDCGQCAQAAQQIQRCLVENDRYYEDDADEGRDQLDHLDKAAYGYVPGTLLRAVNIHDDVECCVQHEQTQHNHVNQHQLGDKPAGAVVSLQCNRCQQVDNDGRCKMPDTLEHLALQQCIIPVPARALN